MLAQAHIPMLFFFTSSHLFINCLVLATLDVVIFLTERAN